MSASIDNIFSQKVEVSCATHSVNASQRQAIGIEAIGGNTPISYVADRYGVSRKFVYQQKDKALKGISQAFEESLEDGDEVLFHIPVTKKWLKQVILALIFICRASYQDVVEFLRDIFDYEICKSTIHNVVYANIEKAQKINKQQDLSKVKEGLLDEIYQAGNPVLVGCCARSTYCFLLNLVETCDANSWGVHLLDLKEKQNLVPNFTVMDGGPSARKGQKDAWPDIPAHGDTFHALKPFLEAVCYLENRAVDALKVVEDLRHKISCPRGKWKEENNQQDLLKRLREAEETSTTAVTLSDDVHIMYKWLKDDILSLVGPSYEDRKVLLKYVIEEFRMRESLCRHRIEPVRRYLENHLDNLLEFVLLMERHFYDIAQKFQVSLSDVLEIYQLKGMHSFKQMRWEKQAALQDRLREKYYGVQSSIDKVLEDTVRASSLVENLNSRLRTYFTLRRELGNQYLDFLQFFLNHRRFMRSDVKERVGKSPTELLTGHTHEHWLEMLGFELFKQVA
jgi:hypothetical protein